MLDGTTQAKAQETYALSYGASGAYYFLPTCPHAANKWRGPFPTEAMMRRAMRDELGEDVAETRTIVRPRFLEENEGHRAALV